MWIGKPVSKWTPAHKMEFLDLLIGLEERDFYSQGEYFFMVKSFMEQSLPVVWEGYLSDVANDLCFHVLDNLNKGLFMQVFNAQLNLSNLIQYLLDNQEGWAWKECTACTGNGDISENSIHWGVDKVTCPVCNGAGKVKHPALLFAEGVK